MPHPQKKLTDELLRQYLQVGYTQEQIARAAGINQATVSRRITRLEQKAAGRLPAIVQLADESLWNVKGALEDVYARLKGLVDTDEDPVRVLSEIRRTVDSATSILETVYTVQAQKEFEDAVLDVLREYDPDVQRKIYERIRQVRSIRAAFIPR